MSEATAPWQWRLPDGWTTKPLFSVGRETKVKNVGLREQNLLSLSYGRIVAKDINTSEGLLPESFETYQIVSVGDIVFRFTDLQNDKRSLRSARVDQRGIITSAYMAFTPTKVSSRFFEYLMRAYDVSKVFYGMGGGLRQSLKYDDVRRMPVVLPPLAEQRGIADFLDRETGKIDALIKKQTELITRLHERRQAVIETCMLTEAEPVKFGYYLDALPGNAFASDRFEPGGEGVRLLRGINVKPGCTDWSERVDWALDDVTPYERYRLCEGDVVLGLDRPFVSGGTRVAAIADADLPALLLQRVVRFRPRVGLTSRFLQLVLASRAFVEYATPEFTGVSVPHLSDSQVRAFRVPLPSAADQERITNTIDHEMARIDELIGKTERMIELSKERRSALITAAVTGQIDVNEHGGAA